jgi:SAM-dependent methyltransferase
VTTDKKREYKKLVKEYDAKQFFDSRYNEMPGFMDQYTLSPTVTNLGAALHYKILELNIIKGLMLCRDFGLNRVIENACDIGAGTGHWVKFLHDDLNAKNIVAIEISTVASKKLEHMFSDYPNIKIANIDISSDHFKYNNHFDLITGIATFHHIVNDLDWESSISNVSSGLKSGGVALITDTFGFWTRNMNFIDSSEFSSWSTPRKHRKTPSKNAQFLMKRSRSLRYYKKTFNKYNCNVERVIWNWGGRFVARFVHQFNLMVIKKN